MTTPTPPVIFLMGPTASGKTDAAIVLRGRFPVDLVSVDSGQVYRGMDIGTAKPDADTLARHPHRLVDIRDPSEAYSAAAFRRDALAAIHEIHAAGRIPLLVGGTLFYFHALEKGLDELPSADPAIRARLAHEAASLGWPALHARLASVAPERARAIHPNDAQRVQRALEIVELTGQAQTEPQPSAGVGAFPGHLIRIVLWPGDRARLSARIQTRFHQMVQGGLVEEVEALRARDDLHADLASQRAAGYRQVWRYLAGECNRETMITQAITATRQLAKRQMTWLRPRLNSPGQNCHVFDMEQSDLTSAMTGRLLANLPA